MKEKKLSFFKKIKISILDFDGYQELAAEKISKTILYIVLLMLIFSIIISITYTYQFTQAIGEIKKYISNEISEIKYENYQLTIIPNNNEEIVELDTKYLMPIKIILNTQTTNEEEIKESIKKINSTENGILILKDKILIKNNFSTNLMEYSYKTISEKYNINKIDKNEVINILSGKEMKTFLLMFACVTILYMFIIYVSSMLIDILLLFVLAYIVTRITGLKLKYSAVYNIATYSLTLPVILNIIYVVVNILTGFTIKYFQVMYTAIASIYIITAILMIKSDIIKKQIELNKIVEEQEKVRQELKRQEEENKQKEEQERKDREKQKEKKEGDINKEPEGDNA